MTARARSAYARKEQDDVEEVVCFLLRTTSTELLASVTSVVGYLQHPELCSLELQILVQCVVYYTSKFL